MGAESRPHNGGTRLRTLAAVILALGGGAAILYAGLLPIPPFSDVPAPLAWQLLGVMGLVAAVGVFQGRPWGRALGIGVTGLDLTLIVFRVATASPPDTVMSLVFSGGLDAVVLWVLVRRWRARA